MAETEYRKYKAEYFPLYLSKSKESPMLTFNTGQKIFRFMPNQGLNENHSSKGVTIAHQLAQEVISEIRTLNLVVKDKRTKPYKDKEYNIEVDNALLEQKIDAYGNVYYADILILFSKPYELSLKWNGFLVLEIFVTSETHGQKIIDFEKKKIPLIEIAIGPKLRLNKSANETSEIDEDNLRKIMHGVFRQQIFGSLHVSPTSDKYKENQVIANFQNKIKELESGLIEKNDLISKLSNAKTELETYINKQHRLIRQNDQIINRQEQEIKVKNDTIRILNSKSFFRKFVEFFD